MCKLIRLACRLVPVKWFRGWLLRAHMEACPACGKGLVIEDGPAGCVRPPDWIRSEASLWPVVRDRLGAGGRAECFPRSAAPVGPFSRISVAAAGVMTAAALFVLLWKISPDSSTVAAGASMGPPRVEVLSAEVQGQKARSSIYQTAGASFIWFSPDVSHGGGQ